MRFGLPPDSRPILSRPISLQQGKNSMRLSFTMSHDKRSIFIRGLSVDFRAALRHTSLWKSSCQVGADAA